MRSLLPCLLTAILVLGACQYARADSITVDYVGTGTDAGLSGQAVFTADGTTTLTIALSNTSTGLPSGFDVADQLLTAIGFDLGGRSVSGGSVKVGAGSTAYFSTGTYSATRDISGEWGYGDGSSGGLAGYDIVLSSMQSNADFAFPGPSLDNPANLNGPAGGLTNGLLALNGKGAVDHSVLISLTLSSALSLSDLGTYLADGSGIEFGSDAAFLTPVPEPGTIALLGLGLGGLAIRRRRTRSAP